MNTEEYKNHNHTSERNKCEKWGTIFKCARENKNYNLHMETVIIYRYPHERIKSFYYSNYQGYKNKLSFEGFVNEIINNNFLKKDKNANGHLRKISHWVSILSKFKKTKFIHLNDLNNFWLKEYGVDITKINIYKTNHDNREEFSDELLNKVKAFYKSEYDYINSEK